MVLLSQISFHLVLVALLMVVKVKSQASSATLSHTTASLTTSAPSSCSTHYDGTFALNRIYINDNRSPTSDPAKQNSSDFYTLVEGNLFDGIRWQAYIDTMGQLQFKYPPVPPSSLSLPFLICGNHTLLLGRTSSWLECRSGRSTNVYIEELFMGNATLCSQIWQQVEDTVNATEHRTAAVSPATSASMPPPIRSENGVTPLVILGIVVGVIFLGVLTCTILWLRSRERHRIKESCATEKDGGQQYEISPYNKMPEMSDSHIFEIPQTPATNFSAPFTSQFSTKIG